eukprot:gnl/MRDRNA2_/MRDRNA2_122202_c0_seq1.p1 gnl/MRDRNA2_/MRDRNA2_122202_c0~~gnl/MRDRNA2_/MRDRNA2_122202_c0_seq1.p1  ORF type:complete len:325 (-),score=60.83 gnl/MRDRNA2_/MRDRNA2_122202_c0_seq1:10-984(-)
MLPASQAAIYQALQRGMQPIVPPLQANPMFAAAAAKAYLGVVVRLDETSDGRKFGFIRCQETQARYNQDIHVKQKDCGAPLKPGLVLQFGLTMFDGHSTPGATQCLEVTDPAICQATKKENDCELLDGVEHFGWVILIDPDKGFTIIECEALQHHEAMYRRGIYVPKKKATSNMTLGMKVRFRLELPPTGGYEGGRCTVIDGVRLEPHVLNAKVEASKRKGVGKSERLSGMKGGFNTQKGAGKFAGKAAGKGIGNAPINPNKPPSLPAGRMLVKDARFGSSTAAHMPEGYPASASSSMPVAVEELEGYMPEDDPPFAVSQFQPY